jgi:hypothetical protein
MNRLLVALGLLASLGSSGMAHARDLWPSQVEHVSISQPGEYSVRIDDRILSFEVLADLPSTAFRAAEVLTRGEPYDSWIRQGKLRSKDCFALTWGFDLGLPFLGQRAGLSVYATVYVTGKPSPSITGYTYDSSGNRIRRIYHFWDYSKPEDLREELSELARAAPGRSAPPEEVILHGRKWYRKFRHGYPLLDVAWEEYYTGLAPDRYLEVAVQLNPVKLSPDLPPRYAPEDQQPAWMRKALRYKEQVISSLRVTRPVSASGPDLYEVAPK